MLSPFAMVRPPRFEHFRFLGDKRTQIVYDLDDPRTYDQKRDLIADIADHNHGQTFGPDTLAEARNRSYRAFRPRTSPLNT